MFNMDHTSIKRCDYRKLNQMVEDFNALQSYDPIKEEKERRVNLIITLIIILIKFITII
jgi:hypothetical protein